MYQGWLTGYERVGSGYMYKREELEHLQMSARGLEPSPTDTEMLDSLVKPKVLFGSSTAKSSQWPMASKSKTRALAAVLQM